MSSFANYDDISQTYDCQRKAAGADIIAGIISMTKALKDTHLLDVGCGTGNYAIELLDHGLGAISLIDQSTGMLEKTKEKLTEANLLGAVRDIKQAHLPNIPFDDNSFDAVMINQVLHHLERNPDGINYPVIDELMKEVRRVLKPDGEIIITTSTPEQEGAHWYTNIIPKALQRYQKRLPPLQILETIFGKNGLAITNLLAYKGYNLYYRYNDKEGPLHETWRSMDSFWTTVTAMELNDCIELVENMKKNKTLEAFYKTHDKLMSVGAFYILEVRLQKSN